MNHNLNLKNKTICITGASGIIGSQLVKFLLNYDCNIKILSRKSYHLPSKKIKIFIGDLLNPILNLEPFVKNCDYFINCAAELNNIQLMYRVNTQSVYRLTSAIKKTSNYENKKVHWIQLSSCGVYGSDKIYSDPDEKFINEDFEPNPQNEYEKTKFDADKILINLGKKNIIDYTILRPSNVISNTKYANIFYRLNLLIKKKFFFKLNFKNSIATYVHIDDLVNSIVVIISNQKSKNNIFNLSLNCNWSKIIDKIYNLNKIKQPSISIDQRITTLLVLLRAILGNFFYIPTLRTFRLRNTFQSTKIEELLGFKFKKLLPENVENFFPKETNIKKKINSTEKEINIENLKDLTVQSNSDILVSVVMAVFNGEKFLAKSIESILCQTLKNFEFIIVNDGSTDSSLKIIQEFSKKDSRIRVINKLNTGLTHSLNCAIDVARGDWIARIDSDDIAAKNRLMEQYLRGIGDVSLVLIGSSCWEIDEFENKIKKFDYPENHNDLKKNLINMKNHFPHSSYFIKTTVLKNINGYKVRMKRAQDYDLSLRLSKFGNITNISKPLIFLRRHKNSISFSDEINQQIIYPRLSLINYYMNNLSLFGPLDENVPQKDFLNLLNIVKNQYNFYSSNIFSSIIKILINKNRYNFFSNQRFSIRDKNEVLDECFKMLFNQK